MPDSTFDFKFRHGIYLTDRIEGKVYKVDVTGKPIGEKRPMLVAAPIPVSPDAPANSPRAETREEPGRSGWWLLPASMTILGVSGALLLVRRWRNRSRDA